MRKMVTVLSLVVSLFFLSIPVQAKERSADMITSGYTMEGIYYEVYGEIPALVQRSGEKLTVSRTVVYDGKVSPEMQVSWREYIDGVLYTGTLYLSQKQYSKAENKTTAIYRGTLTAAR